jgi:hypothetical protein
VRSPALPVERQAPVDLVELQRFLAGALRREAPIPEDPALAEATRAHVAGNDRLTPAEQADLYRQQFWLRHLDCLREDYPGLRALVGDDVFEALARAYLVAHPPRTPSLRDLGADLVPFAEHWSGLASISPGSAALEMLAYEQRFIDLFDGAEPAPLDAQKLSALGEDAWERARIVLHPLLARLRLAYPVHLYRLASIDAETPPPFPEPRDVALVLYRSGRVIQYDEVHPLALALLDELAAGQPLGAACERVSAKLESTEQETFAASIGAWFQDWTAKGWIVDVVV